MPRWSQKKQDEWLARYRESGSIYTQDPCGCVMFVLVDMPEEVKAAAKDIADQVAKGREIRRVADRKDLPPHWCDQHKRANV